MPEGESTKPEFLQAVDRKIARGKKLTQASQAGMINAVSAQVSPDSPTLDTPEKVDAVVNGFYDAVKGIVEQHTGITYRSGGDFDDYKNAVLRTIGIADERTVRATAEDSPLTVIANAANTKNSDFQFALEAIASAADDTPDKVRDVFKNYVAQSPSLKLTGDVKTMPTDAIAKAVLSLYLGGPAMGDAAKDIAKMAPGYLEVVKPAYRD
jgi:hypothetical protein